MKNKIVVMSLLISTAVMISACGGKVEDVNSSASSATSGSLENTVEVVATAEPTATPTVEPTATPVPTTELTIVPSDNSSSSGGGSMTELNAPDIESDDFVVEDMEATTMYMKNDYMAKEGPNAEEFSDSCYLFKGDAVSIVGVVNSYKGEECVWYRANTGEFISAEFITTEKDKVSAESSTQTESKENVDPLAEFTDEEIQAIFDMVAGGNESQFSSDEEKYAYLDSVADTGEIVTIDGRTGMIVSEPSKRYGKLYSMVDENGELIFAYGAMQDGGKTPDGHYWDD